MLTTFTQVPISESTVQRLTETTGLAALAVAEAEAVLIQATWPPVPVGPDTAVVSHPEGPRRRHGPPGWRHLGRGEDLGGWRR